jgi:hypothetical protein
MYKKISMLFMLPFMLLSVDFHNMEKYDMSDRAKQKTITIPTTMCIATFGKYRGMYLKLYQDQERRKTCKELAPLFKHLTIMPYQAGKRKPGTAGNISFDEPPYQCYIELTYANRQLTGIPYGDKALCSSIRSQGTAVLEDRIKKKPAKKVQKQIPKKKELVEGAYAIHILKYGQPHGIGQTFSSHKACEAARVHLTQENAGLDYTYTCMKQ